MGKQSHMAFEGQTKAMCVILIMKLFVVEDGLLVENDCVGGRAFVVIRLAWSIVLPGRSSCVVDRLAW
jgi:hypothetical protein